MKLTPACTKAARKMLLKLTTAGNKSGKRKDEGASYELHMAIWYFLWLADDNKGFYDFKFGVQLQVGF